MNLRNYLNQYTSDNLRDLGRDLLGMPSNITRKLLRIQFFERHLLEPTALQAIWERLGELSQKAVAAAVYSDGEFDASGFVARYGQLPPRPKSRSYWRSEPILLDLFIYNLRIPDDMLPLLQAFVPAPEPFQLTGLETAPSTYTDPYDDEVPLTIVETERIGSTDLLSYLRLLERHELRTTAAGLLNARSTQKLFDTLVDGDFYPSEDKVTYKGTVRIFGLVNFVDQCGFGWRTSVSKAGRTYLQTRDPELLLEAFETWAENGKFDELTRIPAIKRLKSKKTRLTNAAERRSKVIEALSWCPVDVWINIDEFYKAIKIWQFDFDVENPDYYRNLAFGYSDAYFEWQSASDYWRALKGLSINVILWEFLATIGAIDIAYTPLHASYFHLDGEYTYDGQTYSSYDGLRYFRINQLGAFLLGQADSYSWPDSDEGGVFEISADGQISVRDAASLTPDLRMMLELLTEAVPSAEGQYRLTAPKILDTVLAGYEFEFIRTFLSNNAAGSIPRAVSSLLDSLEHNQQAFTIGGSAVLIKARSSAEMTLMQTDPTLSKLCTLVKRNTFVVPDKSLTRVRNRLKELEYLL